MKEFFKRTLCLFMALNVLISSTGFAFVEHICQFKKAKSFSFTKSKACCSEKPIAECHSQKSKSKASFSRSKCCSEKTDFKKIIPQSANEAKLELKARLVVWQNIIDFNFNFNSFIVESFAFLTSHFSCTAPPLAGKTMLIFFQIFRI